jgi:hypothetical protein
MTKFEKELLQVLKGIEAALLALRVPNTVHVPQPYLPNVGQPLYGTWPIAAYGTNSSTTNEPSGK